MLFVLLLAADPETAIQAERAFNAAAQAKGQWTAFREFMTDDAVIFTPQPVRAKESLPEKNPPIAVQWWPAESYVSCDGTMAVNSGPWARPKASGYFTTVWARQADGRFKWNYDGGDALATPMPLPERPKVVRASCAGVPAAMVMPGAGGKRGAGASRDGTLLYRWQVGDDGARLFVAHLWTTKGWVNVIRNQVAAPAK